MAINVKIKGGKELARKLNKVATKVQKKGLRDEMMRGALMITRTARLKAPVDTGRLRASILPTDISSGGNLIIEIAPSGNPTEKWSEKYKRMSRMHPANYAAYVEYKTARTKAQPFLEPALAAHKDEIVASVQLAIDKILRG